MPTQYIFPQLARLLNLITWIENALLITLLAVMVLLAGTQIVFRNLLELSMLGVDQFLRLLVLWVAMLGAITASRADKHINIDMLSRYLKGRAHVAARIVTDVFTVTVCGVLAWQAVRFVESERAAREMTSGAVPVWMAELILPIAFALIALRYGIRLVHHVRQMLRMESLPE